MMYEFREVPINEKFLYLEEEWIKISPLRGSRKADDFIWSFRLDENVEIEKDISQDEESLFS